jgi:tRNA (mo5U34)-methyltransferase
MPGPDRFRHVHRLRQRRDALGWWHSFELPDGTRIDGVVSLENLRIRLAQFPIPEDLRGKRVLDIGAWDGWYSFEMERRGAEVVAIDVWDNPRLREMRSLLGSHVDYRTLDVYDLDPSSIGRFDVVLLLGVLYHLKHPLLALERVCSVTTELAAVDSYVMKARRGWRARASTRPFMEFFESDEFGGQTDNWVAPTLPCLMAFCRTAGFARVELCNELPTTAALACYRSWDDTPDAADAGGEAPRLVAAHHNTNDGINFSSRRDEYVTAWFDVFWTKASSMGGAPRPT